jgi:hypothetical protein
MHVTVVGSRTRYFISLQLTLHPSRPPLPHPSRPLTQTQSPPFLSFLSSISLSPSPNPVGHCHCLTPVVAASSRRCRRCITPLLPHPTATSLPPRTHPPTLGGRHEGGRDLDLGCLIPEHGNHLIPFLPPSPFPLAAAGSRDRLLSIPR